MAGQNCNKVLAPFLGMKPSHIFYIDWIKNGCSCLVGWCGLPLMYCCFRGCVLKNAHIKW